MPLFERGDLPSVGRFLEQVEALLDNFSESDVPLEEARVCADLSLETAFLSEPGKLCDRLRVGAVVADFSYP